MGARMGLGMFAGEVCILFSFLLLLVWENFVNVIEMRCPLFFVVRELES